MKYWKFYMLLAVWIFAQNSAQAQCWDWQNPMPNGKSITDLQMLNANLGYRVGFSTIQKTTNGGISWSETAFASPTNLFGVHFIDANVGFVSGNEVVLKTVDGGTTWTTSYNSMTNTGFLDVFFVDNQIGWAIGTFGVILKTTNAGLTWSEQTSNTGKYLRSIFFIDANNGYVVGDGGIYLKTSNGGSTWTISTLPSGNLGLNHVYFIPNTNTGIISGDQGVLLRTTDLGNSWSSISTAAIYDIESCDFFDSSKGIVVGESGQVLLTNDGGASWVFKDYCCGYSFSAVDIIGSKAWATGSNGCQFISLDEGSTWSTSDINYIFDIEFVGTNNGWCVGGNGTILHTTDGGSTWSNQMSGSNEGLLDITFIDSNKGWISGSNGLILFTSNGGTSWLTQPSGTTKYLSSIFFFNAQNGWAVGESGTILRTTDGGSQWDVVPSGINEDINAVVFADIQEGWAVCNSGIILHTVNGGINWTPQNSGVTQNLFDVDFVDNQKGWAVGSFSTILHTVDGGATWLPQGTPKYGFINSVKFIDALNGFTAGNPTGSCMLKTTNGGNTWTSFASNASEGNYISVINKDNIWIAGNGGAILKRNTTPPPCMSTLIQPLNNANQVPIETQIIWNNLQGCVDGYKLSIGTTPGSSNLLDLLDVGIDTIYSPVPQFPYNQTIYVRIFPYVGTNISSGCTEFSFATVNVSCRTTDSLALTQLHAATNGPNWTNKWNLAQPMTTWHGVALNASGCVTTLDLDGDGALGDSQNKISASPGNNLSGSLPWAWLDSLNSLQTLILRGNTGITGNIDPAIGNLKTLRILSLSHTGLSGTIPSSIGNLDTLTYLEIDHTNISGPLPPEIGSLPMVQYLELDNNTGLTGTSLPNTFNGLTSLLGFYADSSGFSGSIPNTMASLASLRIVELFNNQLSGTIPAFTQPLLGLRLENNRFDGCAAQSSNSWGTQPWQGLQIQRNRLTFDDVLANKAIFDTNPPSAYAPQDSFYRDTVITATAGQDLTIDLGIDAAVSSNVYDWNKVSGGIVTITGNNKRTFTNIQAADAGTYYVKVFNPNAAELTLNSRKIEIKVTAGCRSADSLELVYLNNFTTGANWTNKWNLAQPIDTWYGVTLNAQGCVQGIELDNNQLDGGMPSLDLPELQILNLSQNNLSGTIPSLNFPELKQLYLNNNILSGNIPNFSLPKLEELLLYANKLNGPIPNFNLPQLKTLLLFTNQLSGGVPNFNLPNLQHLDLSENPLGGGIPNFNLPNLQIIALCYNQLTGSIPNFGMPLLRTLNLFGNQLDNSIPNFNLPNLKELNLYDNLLSGAIPNFNLPLLETLHLASNQLSGPIPNFNFPQLRSLLLDDNQLSGTVPNLNLPQLVRLSLSDNRLDGLPSLTQLPSLGLTAEPSDSLTVYNNKLTFQHILPNLALFAQMNGRAKYAPQDSFYRDTIITVNAGQNLTIDLGIDVAVSSNIYAWNKVSGGTTTITGNNKRIFSNIQAADAGMYYVKVTNPNAAELTLNSRKITLVVSSACRQQDSLTLVALYNATIGANWTNKWNLAQPMTTWAGVTLNASDCVQELKLTKNNLTGTLPAELANLSALVEIKLDSNTIGGNIPNLSLPDLKWLDMSNNRLIGSIPNFNAPNLEFLDVGFNSITSTIPNFNLPKLITLSLQSLDSLTGNIPNFNLPSLQYLHLGNNRLSGSIPNFNLPQLAEIELGSNSLSGAIPNFNLPNLDKLDLDRNQLTGTIPTFNLPNLRYLYLNINQLNGTIPNFNLPNLVILQLQKNQLTGTIPALNLPALQRLFLQDNDLSGCFPTALQPYCSLGFSTDVDVDGYNFTNNPKLPWQGDFQRFCNGETQTGASCDDGNTTTLNETIQANCLCAVSVPICRSQDSLTLVALYNATTGANWTNKWNLAQPITTWTGVSLDANGCVDTVELLNRNLVGSLPGSIGNLSKLKKLFIGFNPQLGGNIPSLSGLVNALEIDLTGNGLTGTLPGFDLPNLKTLLLGKNKLTGLPFVGIDGMDQLEVLNLAENQLTGNLPALDLPALKEVFFSQNQFNGTNVPNYALPNLEKLHFHTNQLKGTIPQFTNLPKLKQLSAFNNDFDSLATQNAFILSGQPFELLELENNAFTFDDIRPNIQRIVFTGVPSDRSYAPQDSAGQAKTVSATIGQPLSIALGFDENEASSFYNWFKDGQAYPPPVNGSPYLTFSSIQAQDAGVYYAKVTNVAGVPDLTLTTRPITIVIGCVATTTNFSRAVCPGDTVLFNGEVFDIPGTYSRTITATSGCDSTLVLTLSHLPLPNVNAGADQRVCAGSTVNLSASGGQSYRWSNGGTTANIQITPLTSGSLTVTVTGSNGCSKTDSVNVFVNIVPDVNPAPDQTVCNGQMTQAIPHTGTFPSTTFDGANNMPSIGLGASALNVTSIAPFTALNNGTAPVVATVTVTPKLTANGLTCIGKPDTFTITVNPSAKPNITGKLTICPGGNTILNATGGNSYLWSTGASIASLTVNTAGVYTVTATATGGCTASATAQVTAQPAPNPKIGSTGLFAVCQGDSITLSPGTFNQYLWSTGATTATIRVPSPNNLYAVTVTDINTCTATATASVTQLQKVVASIATPDTLTCLATQITLDGSGSDSGIFYTHNWSTPDGQIVSGANTLKAVVDKPGQYRLTVTGPTTTCPNTATVTVVAQNQAPSAVALTPKDVSCKGQTDGQLTVGQVSGGLAPFQYALNGDTFGTTQVFTQLLPGNYTLEVRGRNGCVLSQTFTIKEGLGLNPNLGTNRLVCPGIAAVLDAGSFAGYQWSNNQTTQVLNATTPGTYTVTVSDGKGCTGTAAVSVQHHPAVTALATAMDTLTCTKGSVPIRSNGSSSGTGIVYQWSTANGNLVSGANTGTATVDKGGNYQLVVRNSQSGCADTAQVTVIQTGKPISGLALEVTDIRCAADQNGQIVASVAGSGTQPFAYNLNGGTFQSNGRFTGLAQGAYTIAVRGADGCEALTTASIDAPDVLQVSIPAPKLLEEGATVDLQPIVSGAQGALTYAWEGSNLSCNDCAEPNAAPVFNTGYALTVTDENGCTASATVLVAVNSNLGPDIITPGSPDGKNDELYFPDLETAPANTDNDIVIFNRWGQVVFKAAPYLNNWKGETENGVALPEGTYYYVLLLRDGKKNAIHGNVLLIR